MQKLNKLLGLLFFVFYWATPLSIGQEIRDTAAIERIDLLNASFEKTDKFGEPNGWDNCNFSQAVPPQMQPGAFGCQLLAQQGKLYLGMVAHENGSFEATRQSLLKPLKAGVCYRMSVFLAKSSVYSSKNAVTGADTNFIRPLKLTIWGLSGKNESKCTILPEDWLAESLPIHNDGWRKYTFYIQAPKDIYTLVFSANHVVPKPYNGNLLLDNISSIEPVNCTDLRLMSGGQRGVFLALQQVSEVISENGPKMVFGKKNTRLKADVVEERNPDLIGKGGHNKAFDQLLAYFEQTENYKLIIRVKNDKKLSKQRIAYLYSYIFRNTNLKAQRVEIKAFSPKDETYFWTFENDELAISFDSM